jgi:hypothetical protein
MEFGSMNRKSALSVMAGAIGAAFFGTKSAKAQFTEQEIRNGADVVATGDVNISQSASGSQGVYIDGQLVTEDGIYSTSTGQVVVNNGRVVATGDVNVSQSASGTQTVVTRVFPTGDGEPARVCEPGAVIANPSTGQVFYQRDDCCWYAACANGCKKRGCEGDYCG